jgi:hypothetical protein
MGHVDKKYLKNKIFHFFCHQVVHTDHGHNNGSSGVNLDICRGGKEDPTTFFRDGIRKIDFVLVRRYPVFYVSSGFPVFLRRRRSLNRPIQSVSPI